MESETPWFGAPKLVIRRRDCTELIGGLERLAKRLTREGPLDPVRIERIAHELAAALPPAR